MNAYYLHTSLLGFFRPHESAESAQISVLREEPAKSQVGLQHISEQEIVVHQTT